MYLHVDTLTYTQTQKGNGLKQMLQKYFYVHTVYIHTELGNLNSDHLKSGLGQGSSPRGKRNPTQLNLVRAGDWSLINKTQGSKIVEVVKSDLYEDRR